MERVKQMKREWRQRRSRSVWSDPHGAPTPGSCRTVRPEVLSAISACQNLF